MSRVRIGLVVALWSVALPARADVCKSLGVGSTDSSRVAISTEVRPAVGEPLLMTLEVVSGVPQLVLKAKSAKPAETGKTAVFTFDGGTKGSWTFEAPADGTYVFSPLEAAQLELLEKNALLHVALPLKTGGNDDFALDKVNQKALMDGAKCVASRTEG
jgi:hypothetical protein